MNGVVAHTSDFWFGYCFAFNGMEQDDEVSGNGNTIAFEARIYDSRLGGFFSTDPWFNEYSAQSTYCFAGNSPITFVDKDGKGPVIIIGSPEQAAKVKAALEVKDYDEVYRILLYGACNGFVGADGVTPSDHMPNRLLKEKSLTVEENSSLIDGGADMIEGILIQGVFENEDGELEVQDIGRITDPVGYKFEQAIAANPKSVVKTAYEKRQVDLGFVKVPTKITAIRVESKNVIGGGLSKGPASIVDIQLRETHDECIWVHSDLTPVLTNFKTIDLDLDVPTMGLTVQSWTYTYEIDYKTLSNSDKARKFAKDVPTVFMTIYDSVNSGADVNSTSTKEIIINNCNSEDCVY